MGFCARYDSRSQYLDQIDELIIPFHDGVENLAEFLTEHSHQRVILDIKSEWRPFFGAILTPIWAEHQNLVLRFEKLDQELIGSIKTLGIPYFSKEIAVEWELFNRLISYGVSDVYVSEQLGFELRDVSAAAALNGIRTRVFPNIVQSALTETNELHKFFIRPEDADLYNRRYISTFEFYIPENIDLNWDVLYRAYAINKKWLGPLSEIILGLDIGIDNTFIHPSWGEYRMNCRRSCLKTGSCRHCDALYELSKSLKLLEVMPNRPKDGKSAAKIIMDEIDRKDINAAEPLPPPVVPNF